MTCSNIEMLLATRRDLSPDEEHAVQTHLLSCERCAAVWQRERRTTQLLQALPVVQATPTSQVVQQIRARLTRPPRRRTPQVAVATVVGLCCLILLSAVAAQAYPQTVRQAAARIGLAANADAFASAQDTSSALPSAPALGNGSRSAAQESLYVIKLLMGEDRLQVTGSRTSATNPTTGAVRVSIDQSSDAIVSPDGSRLYAIVGNSDGLNGSPQERVVAFDAHTGQEVWRSELIMHRSMYILGRGPSTLATSPDGRWLYIHSYDGVYEHATWFQIVDTSTGALLPDVAWLPSSAGCGGPTFASPASGNSIYINCRYAIQTFNVDTHELAPFSLPAPIVDSIMSPDKRTLYAFSPSAVVFVIDAEQQRVVQQVDLMNGDTSPFTLKNGLTAVSNDGTTLVVGQADATSETSELRVFDTRTWQERARIQRKGAMRPFTLAVNFDGNRVYATMEQWDNGGVGPPQFFVEFDTATGQVVREEKLEREEILRLFMGP